MTPNKVFISSTVHDLIDIRAEVYSLISEIGLKPVMSDYVEGGFDSSIQANSIETCLVNLRECAKVIVILSQRYGGKLKVLGLPELSATHLEYQEAKRCGIPTLFYVRDRLFADYGVWKKSEPKAKLPISWVSENNYGIFDFLRERESLGDDTVNWISIFANSVELKGKIRSDLKVFADENSFDRDFKTFSIPALVPYQKMFDFNNQAGHGKFLQEFKNCGKAPALKIRVLDISSGHEEETLFLPEGESLKFISVFPLSDRINWYRRLDVTYEDAKKNKYKDTFEAYIKPNGNGSLISGLRLKSKEFFDAAGKKREGFF